MPCHYSYVDTIMAKRYAQATDSVVFSMRAEIDFNVIRDAIDSVARALGLDTLRKEFDSRMITADFLIKNIDEAFRDWKNGKWARHIDFAIFCECILPYKTGTTDSTWDNDTNTLTLNGVNFETTAATAVQLPAGATIVLNGENTITDIGHITDTILQHIERSEYLVIESNYDNDMLMNGPYPYPLKMRIAGNNGHLSNTCAAETIFRHSHHLKHTWLCHLSENNNTPQHALDAMKDIFAQNHSHLDITTFITVLKRTSPTGFFNLS